MRLHFQREGRSAEGDWLAGAYQFAVPTRLLEAWVRAEASTGLTVLEAYVGGVATGYRVQLAPSRFAVVAHVRLGFLVAAGDEVRWQVVTAPATSSEQALDVVVTVAAVQETAAGAGQSTPALYVRWISGSERLVLWDYDPDTRAFTERSPGVSSGRASVTQGSDTSISIVSSGEVLAVSSGVLTVSGLFEEQRTGYAAGARLEFCWLGADGVERVLAQVNASGQLLVANVTEASVPAGVDRFEFPGTGAVKVALTAGGLLAEDMVEA